MVSTEVEKDAGDIDPTGEPSGSQSVGSSRDRSSKLVTTFFDVFRKFDTHGLRDGFICPLYDIAVEKGLVVKGASRFCFTVYILGRMVEDAGLLHPSQQIRFHHFKNLFEMGNWNPIENVFKDVETAAAAGSPSLFENNWVSGIVSVICHFVDLEGFNSGFESSTDFSGGLAKTTEIITGYMQKRPGVSVAITRSEDDSVTGTFTNVPNFRFNLLMDFSAKFHRNETATSIAGVSQAFVNYRVTDRSVFEKMEKAFLEEDDESIYQETFEFPEDRVAYFSASRDYRLAENMQSEPPPIDLRIGSALEIHEDDDEEGMVYYNRYTQSLTVHDAVEYGRLWLGESGLLNKLKLLEHQTVKGQKHFKTKLDDGNFQFYHVKSEDNSETLVVAPDDEDPHLVTRVLQAALQKDPKTFVLTRNTIHSITRLLMVRYFLKIFPVKTTKDKIPRMDETADEIKELLSRTFNSDNMNWDLPSCGGILWLTNLAYHPVRLGLVSGRHRCVSEIMGLLGCAYVDSGITCKFQKSPLFQSRLRKSDFIYHQLNSCINVSFALANSKALESSIQRQRIISKKVDQSSDKKIGNKFGFSFQKALASFYNKMNGIKVLAQCFTDQNSFLPPASVSLSIKVEQTTDYTSFYPDVYDLKFESKFCPVFSENPSNDLLAFAKGIIAAEVLEDERCMIGSMHSIRDGSAFVKLSKLKENNSPFSPEGLPHHAYLRLQKYLHVSHHKHFNPDTLKSYQNSKVSSSGGSTVFKIEEFVHSLLFASIFREMVEEAAFQGNCDYKDSLFMGACPYHFYNGVITKGFQGTNISKSDKRNALPQNLQLLVYITTILYTLPQGRNLLKNCFFNSRVSQNSVLTKMYSADSEDNSMLSFHNFGDLFQDPNSEANKDLYKVNIASIMISHGLEFPLFSSWGENGG